MARSAPTIDGEVVRLRAVEVDDAAAWLAGEDDEQRRWFEPPGPGTIETVTSAIVGWRRSWSIGGPIRHWGVEVDRRLAGGVEIRLRDDGCAALSYVVFPFARRRGVATEAVELAIGWASHGLDASVFVAIVDERNVASRRLLDRAGFVCEGRADRHEHTESGPMLRYRREVDRVAPDRRSGSALRDPGVSG